MYRPGLRNLIFIQINNVTWFDHLFWKTGARQYERCRQVSWSTLVTKPRPINLNTKTCSLFHGNSLTCCLRHSGYMYVKFGHKEQQIRYGCYHLGRLFSAHRQWLTSCQTLCQPLCRHCASLGNSCLREDAATQQSTMQHYEYKAKALLLNTFSQ